MARAAPRFRWILFGIVCVFVLGWAFRVGLPFIQERPDRKLKPARFAEMRALLELVSTYRASHGGSFPDALTDLAPLIESSRKTNTELRSASDITRDYAYVRPTSVADTEKTFATPMIIERLGHYRTQDGGQVGMVAGTVRWHFRPRLLEVLRESNIPTEIVQ
jgi:hypothetical protein